MVFLVLKIKTWNSINMFLTNVHPCFPINKAIIKKAKQINYWSVPSDRQNKFKFYSPSLTYVWNLILFSHQNEPFVAWFDLNWLSDIWKSKQQHYWNRVFIWKSWWSQCDNQIRVHFGWRWVKLSRCKHNDESFDFKCKLI